MLTEIFDVSELMKNTHDNQILQAKQNADLPAIIEAAGIELRPAGGDRLKGLCPYHPERTPSFIVYRESQSYHCFGCGEHGDVIDFLQHSRGLSFPEALKFLGADDYRVSKSEKRAILAKQRIQKALERRERDLAWTIGKAIRIAENILSDTSNNDWTIKVLILQHLETLKYQHQIFIDGDADDRAALVADLVTISSFPRGKLFIDDFDYNRWNWEATQKTDGVKNGQRAESNKNT